MKLERSFLERAKSELNFLYTEKPAWKAGGMDDGWFCREHAFHVHTLCRLKNWPSEIALGHFAIHFPGYPIRRSLHSGADHAWNTACAVSPIDLSITFGHYDVVYPALPPQLAGPVLGGGANGPFKILTKESLGDFEALLNYKGQDPWVCYYAEKTLALPMENGIPLWDGFLLPSGDGAWWKVFGPDIFSKVSTHVYKVAERHVSPLLGKMSPQDAIRHIASQYRGANNFLRKKLLSHT